MISRGALIGFAAVAAMAPSTPASEPTLLNPSFEEPGDAPAGWTIGVGAQSGSGGESGVAIDRDAGSHGGASLRLSGSATTGTWRIVEQEIDVAALDRVTLRTAVRCRGVVREKGQFSTAGATLSFWTATGTRIELLGTPALSGDHHWAEVVIDTIAPRGAVKAKAGVFLSMTGTVWFDDVRLVAAPATAGDAAGRERAFDALAEHLARTYPFFGLAGKPEPDELFERHRSKAIAAKDETALLAEIRAMLAELNDVHVSLETAERRFATASPDPRPANFNPVAMQAALTERTAYEQGLLLAGRIGSGAEAVGYAAIASFQLDEARIAKVIAAIDALADTKALILDVRPNGGGDETLAARIAGRFTKEPVVYARSIRRDPLEASTGAFGSPIDRTLKPVAPFDGRRVVVLQGPSCVSSTEGFLAMMRALPSVTTIGLPSRGASGNPAPFDLVPGVKVWTSRWRSLTPDGECIEGKGVAPEIVVEGSHATSDPTLERALAELAR